MSCWDCKFQDINKQDTLLGYCNWFFDFKLEDTKPIPPNVVDKGCEKFQSRVPNNADEAFKKDLAAGEETQDKVLKRIREEYPKAYQKEGYFKEYDIMIPEIDRTVEVKSDVKSLETGNYVVEVAFDGKPSALSTTTADYWVFYDSECLVWITPDNIWRAVKSLPIREFVGKGDEKSKNAYLCPKDYIRIVADFINPIY